MKYLKKSMIASAVLLLSLTLTGCGGENTVDPTSVSVSVKPYHVTIHDGSTTVVIEDASDKTVSELLNLAEIPYDENTQLTIEPDTEVSKGMTIEVLRTITVQIIKFDENNVLVSTETVKGKFSTIQDVLTAIGISDADPCAAYIDKTAKPYQNMKIILSGSFPAVEISLPEVDSVPEETEPESTVETTAPTTSNTPGSNSGSGTNTGSNSNSNFGNHSTPTPTTAPTTPPTEAPTMPTEPAPTEPPETEPPARTVVNTEYYDDCDGSGHGVKVVTYSDGSQEEIPY